MLLTFKNSNLVPVIKLLNSIEIKGKYSRSRSKVVNVFMQKFEELQKDERSLIEEYCNKDENGEVVMLDSTTFDVPKELEGELTTAKAELFAEEFSIETGELDQHFLNLRETLENLDKLLKGDEADIYDIILDELDKL